MTKGKEEVLGVGIDVTPESRLLKKIYSSLKRKQKLYIVTPNPEIIMLAQKDRSFFEILNGADVSIPDGIGVVAALKFLNLKSFENKLICLPTLLFQGFLVGASIIFNKDWLTREVKVIKGRDMFLKLIAFADKKNLKVSLLGNKEKSAQKALKKLKNMFSGTKFYAYSAPMFDNNALPKTDKDKRQEAKVVRNINIVKPDFVFVGFGAPKQEKWIAKWIDKLNVSCMMAVGGTFDYISGTTKLPPEWVEELNLEWLYRLITGSQKLKRVYKAFPIFPLKVFWSKLTL